MTLYKDRRSPHRPSSSPPQPRFRRFGQKEFPRSVVRPSPGKESGGREDVGPDPEGRVRRGPWVPCRKHYLKGPLRATETLPNRLKTGLRTGKETPPRRVPTTVGDRYRDLERQVCLTGGRTKGPLVGGRPPPPSVPSVDQGTTSEVEVLFLRVLVRPQGPPPRIRGPC